MDVIPLLPQLTVRYHESNVERHTTFRLAQARLRHVAATPLRDVRCANYMAARFSIIGSGSVAAWYANVHVRTKTLSCPASHAAFMRTPPCLPPTHFHHRREYTAATRANGVPSCWATLGAGVAGAHGAVILRIRPERVRSRRAIIRRRPGCRSAHPLRPNALPRAPRLVWPFTRFAAS